MSHPLRKTLLLAALCAAAGAHAEGLYVGGALSAPEWRDSVNGFGDGSGGNGPGLKLYGGWQFNPWFAVEGGYFNLGRSHDTNGRAKAWGLFADAVGRYEFAPSWSVLGSAGLAQARLSTPNGSDNSPALKLGVGLQYDVSRMMSVRLGYDNYKFTSAYGSRPNVGQTTLGVNMAF